MPPLTRHDWNLTPAQAVQLQWQLAPRVVRRGELRRVARIAGVDVGFEDRGRITRAAVTVHALAGMELLETRVARRRTGFPYVPGLLSFRELPAVLDAFAALDSRPDAVLCDGQGLAHPRRFGIACHLGLWLDLPTIGVGKSRLVGSHGPVPPQRGAEVPLMIGDECIGIVLRSRSGVRPLYVSIGHRVSLPAAVRLVLACCTRYRLPEPLRAAHRAASGD